MKKKHLATPSLFSRCKKSEFLKHVNGQDATDEVHIVFDIDIDS